jgi:hypothetical protein
LTRMPLLFRFAQLFILARAFAEHCRTEGVDAKKATTDELMEFRA